MRAAAQQPYFFPYSGFFLKAMLSDVFVLMDDVQFPLGSGWVTRNRFKNSVGVFWLSVPVWKKGLGLQKIREVKICHDRTWKRKHIESLEAAYGHSPFFEEHHPFLRELYSAQYERLVDMNKAALRYLFKALGIRARLQLLSELAIEEREPLLSVKLAERLGASHFIAQSSARKYLDDNIFRKAHIGTIFFSRKVQVYPQLWSGFSPNLSVLDLIFNCGPAAPRIILNELRERDSYILQGR